MRFLLLPVLSVLAAVLMAGCSGTPLGMKDCGSVTSNSPDDPAMVCFKQAALNCSQARVRIDTSKIQSAGYLLSPKIVMLEEVRGGTAEACQYYIKMEEVSAPPGMSDEQRQIFNAVAGVMNGKEMLCTLSTDEISPVTASPTGNDFTCRKCTGSMVDLMKSMGSCPYDASGGGFGQKTLGINNCKIAAVSCGSRHMLDPSDPCSGCDELCPDYAVQLCKQGKDKEIN